MLTGVALPLSEIPPDLIVPHNLGPRVYARGGNLEVQFLFRHADRILPFLQDGQLRIARWGNRRGESRHLPCSGWTWQATLEGGGPDSVRRQGRISHRLPVSEDFFWPLALGNGHYPVRDDG
jgi:hypothetical protein